MSKLPFELLLALRYLRPKRTFVSIITLISVVGVALGVTSTTAYAHTKGWATVVPPEAWLGGFAASLIIGAAAGLMPALRAARMSPTQALWSL